MSFVFAFLAPLGALSSTFPPFNQWFGLSPAAWYLMRDALNSGDSYGFVCYVVNAIRDRRRGACAGLGEERRG